MPCLIIEFAFRGGGRSALIFMAITDTSRRHGFPAQFGFTALPNPSRMMEIVNADAHHAEQPPT